VACLSRRSSLLLSLMRYGTVLRGVKHKKYRRDGLETGLGLGSDRIGIRAMGDEAGQGDSVLA